MPLPQITDQDNENKMETKLEQVVFHEELFISYLQYGKETLERAIPSVIDGCKKVHRRILYAMYKNNMRSNKKYTKCAAVVGATISEFHPHGDMSIYNALVRLAQDFVLKHPLVDGQGNFGSIDGDSAAAYRYTECRLSPIAELLLDEIGENTTDFQLNYDGSSREPVHLVPQFPVILISGAQGIGVGYSSNIPCHNLAEVIDATIMLINNPEAPLAEIMEFIQGPDFPTAGFISSREALYKAYEKGEGMIRIRGRAHFEGDDKIIIREIPYQIQKSNLIEKMIEVAKSEAVDGISSVRDESDHEIRIVIELKKRVQKEVVLNQLYKMTPLSISYKVNLLALNREGFPELFPLKKILTSFIDFRHSTIVRKTTYKLEQYQEKIHILFGYTIILDNINTYIEEVRNSHDTEHVKNMLLNNKWKSPTLYRYMEEINMAKNDEFSFTEFQVKSILDFKVTNLTKMAGEDVIHQIEKLRTAIVEGRKIIDSKELRNNIIKEDLINIKKYSTVRKTVIDIEEQELQDEDFIPKEDVVITLSNEGYLKRVPLHMYKEQKRGGRGSIGFQNNHSDTDKVLQVVVANSHDLLLIFTDSGKVYSLKSYQIPEGSKNTKGRFVLNCLDISEEDKVIKILPFKSGEESIIFATNKGTIRKNAIGDFMDLRRSGKIYMKPEHGVKTIGVVYGSSLDEVMLFTKLGKAIRFNINVLRMFTSRNSMGVRGCQLSKNDEVVSMVCLKEENKDKMVIMTITSNGLGKATNPEEYRRTSRGTKGVNNIKLKKNQYVVSVMELWNNQNEEEENNILVVTNGGQIINCAAKDIRAAGRVTQGVIVVKLKNEDYIVSATKI